MDFVASVFGSHPPRVGVSSHNPDLCVRFIAANILFTECGLVPAPELSRFVTEEVMGRLRSRARQAARPCWSSPGHLKGRIHLCRVNESTIEATIVAVGTQRIRTVALRMEHQADAWKACALALL
jgi:hypothetical protein